MRKIDDLLDDAIKCEDYERKINFLLAGLLSEEANDTKEKEITNMGYLKNIYNYCINYNGDKEDYMKRTADRIKKYVYE